MTLILQTECDNNGKYTVLTKVQDICIEENSLEHFTLYPNNEIINILQKLSFNLSPQISACEQTNIHNISYLILLKEKMKKLLKALQSFNNKYINEINSINISLTTINNSLVKFKQQFKLKTLNSVKPHKSFTSKQLIEHIKIRQNSE